MPATIGGRLTMRSRGTLEQTTGIDCVQVNVTVISADNLPRLTDILGRERRFYAVITNGVTKKTKSIRSQRQSVVWNERLDGFESSETNLSVYVEHAIRGDELVGCIDVRVPFDTEYSIIVPSALSPNLTVVLKVHHHDLIGSTKEALNMADSMLTKMHIHDEWDNTVGNIMLVLNAVQTLTQFNSYSQTILNVISLFPKIILSQLEHDKNVRALIKALQSAFELSQAESLLKTMDPYSNQATILKAMLRHVQLCSEVIQRYAKDTEFNKRLRKNVIGGTAKEINDLCLTLAKLRQDFLDNAVISTQVAVQQIQRSIDMFTEQTSNTALDFKMAELPYKSGWRSITNVEKHGCFPGTRTKFLNHIMDWVDDPSSEIGLVLFGQAGTGKTTISHEIALRFQLEDRLASYFSFTRQAKGKLEDYHLFTTIIHDLANRYPAFKAALGSLIQDDQALRATDQFELLFNTLLLGPLRAVNIEIPVLIIIDALDESGDETEGRTLVEFLGRHLGQLPPMFRVFITSRLDSSVEANLAPVDPKQLSPFHIVSINDPKLANTENDIRLYFQDPRNLPSDLFSEYGEELIQKSECLFQWAAVACGYIRRPPPGWTKKNCLRGLLNRSIDDRKFAQQLKHPLYDLYSNILHAYFNTEIAQSRFRSVMGHLLAAAEPFSNLSLSDLRQFIGTDNCKEDAKDEVFAIVNHLGALLSHATSEDLPVAPLHTSFRDFLTEDIKRAGAFWIDLGKSHKELAHACLDMMLRELKFNVIHFPSSYLTNLDTRVETQIQPALCYSCRSWDDHLEHMPFEMEMFEKLERLFREKFLYWLEVLSITQSVHLAVEAFLVVRNWLHRSNDAIIADRLTMFNDFITDAYQFLRYFATPIAESAAHIYVSALPFTPRSSKIYETYSPMFPNTITFHCGQPTIWPALEMSIQTGHRISSIAISPDRQTIATASEAGVLLLWNATTGRTDARSFTQNISRTVAFSPDGKSVLAASNDKMACLWDVSGKTPQRRLLIGHTEMVTSAVFSPDGKWILSCSEDKTCILWNVSTGQIERGPYNGPTMGSTSVAISLDGETIVSGSRDKRIYVWNTFTEQSKHSPLIGHTDEVTSIAFSSTNVWIVSGSNDKTLILWNALTGQLERGPMTGHAGKITSVAFSPDGSRIISGSHDTTIRLWNTATAMLLRIFEGHVYWVTCVAFSSDGQRIVSGSYDRTFSVWDASTKTSQFVTQSPDINDSAGELRQKKSTFDGHTNTINSVVFSPDGKWIVSGADDNTLCIWSASTGKIKIGPIKGHTDSVSSVVFSLDGECVASGSDDGTIRIWNASTGEPARWSISEPASSNTAQDDKHVVKPFSMHKSSINSIHFSPGRETIVSGSFDHTIRLWDALTGKSKGVPLTGHSGPVTSVAFSPDGKWIGSGSFDKTICLWDASTGEMKLDPFTGHTAQVASIAFSPNGESIISGSFDSTLRLWNVLTGKSKRGPFVGHTGVVTSVAFSPNAEQVVSCSVDSTIRLWSISSGTLEYIIPSGHLNCIFSVSFSPGGTHIVSGGEDRTIRLTPVRATPVNIPEEVSFNDQSVIDPDGWIRGNMGELVLWIPSLHRSSLYRPNVPTHIIGSHETRLNTSKFVHGKHWTNVVGSR